MPTDPTTYEATLEAAGYLTLRLRETRPGTLTTYAFNPGAGDVDVQRIVDIPMTDLIFLLFYTTGDCAIKFNDSGAAVFKSLPATGLYVWRDDGSDDAPLTEDLTALYTSSVAPGQLKVHAFHEVTA